MSDSAQILAARVEPASAAACAARVLAWLVEQGVVEAMPTDSGLGALAHRPGPKALDVVVAQKPGVYDFRRMRTNGVQISHGLRPELQMGGDETSFSCPSCAATIDLDAVFSRLTELASPFSPIPEVACPRCAARVPIDALVVEGGAFANVALRFWNWWPLEESFVAQLERLCGAPLVVLHERV